MCMEQQGEECSEPLQVLVRYFCGTAKECNMKSAKMGKFGALNNWDKVAKAAELAKKKIITQYYSIGLMGKPKHGNHHLRMLYSVFGVF